MKGVIWSLDRKGDGIERLKYIRDRYLWSGVNVVREVYNSNQSWIEFDNGDIWTVRGASESGRGVRSNVAWIDSRIDDELLHCVILRTLTSYIGPRYYEFFNVKV